MENKNLFIELARVLNAKGANIEMEYCFIGEECVITNAPVVRGYMGPEGEGFYFRASRRYFGMSDLEFAQSFPINIDGYTFRMVSFDNSDSDDDRYWPESVSFIIEKDGKNVLA